MFSCEFCKISKNIFFTEHLRATAPEDLACLRSATLLKKGLWHRCFPVNFVNFLRTPIFREHLRWLLLLRGNIGVFCELLSQFPVRWERGQKSTPYQGRIQRFWKGRLCVGHHGWPAKKVLDFRWSKKAEIALKTINFWQNIYISIFKFSPFLSIKFYQFFKIY